MYFDDRIGIERHVPPVVIMWWANYRGPGIGSPNCPNQGDGFSLYVFRRNVTQLRRESIRIEYEPKSIIGKVRSGQVELTGRLEYVLVWYGEKIGANET